MNSIADASGESPRLHEPSRASQGMSAKSLLRFIACGSVDDGKSTLIGRLLYESNQLTDDPLPVLHVDSRRMGTRGSELDFALLLDGLPAEREQGITIDVAYRYFGTPRRKFIVADTPGHVQYTRNVITGASTADAAVILIDARKGMLQQTRRHAYLVALLGVREIIVAVNKMDLVDFGCDVFERIEADVREFCGRLHELRIQVVPVCAVEGDNIVRSSDRMPWYRGPSVLEMLESIEIDQDRLQHVAFRMPVQSTIRHGADFRGFAGTIAAGTIRPGDNVRVLPSGQESVVTRIVTADAELALAIAGQAVTLTLRDEIDVSCGDVISSALDPAQVGTQFDVTLAWLHEQPLLRGRAYLFKCGTRAATATVAPLKHRVDLDTLQPVAAETLAVDEIGEAEIELDRSIAFDPYDRIRGTGSFILIDRLTRQTVGAGMIRFALRRSSNVRWQALAVDKAARQRLSGHGSAVIWLTGLSGAGKSALADALERRLHADGRRTYVLDGDNLRYGLNKDLGFTPADRVENIRRAAEVARLMVDAGIIVIAAFISPFRSEREMARALFSPGEFVEVYVDVPLAVAEDRDAKGLYAKARRGELPNFTGIDSPYEPPLEPDLRVETAHTSIESCRERVMEVLIARGVLDAAPRS